MYSDFRDIRSVKKRQLRLLEEAREVFPAVIVSEGGSTDYDELGPNYTWISLYNQTNNRHAAFNPTTLTEAGTAVLVARQPRSPYRWEIIGSNNAYEHATSSVPFSQFNTGPHAPNHMVADEASPGSDPVFVSEPMMLILKTVGDGATLTVSTYPYDYSHGGASKYFPGQDTDLTSSVPGAGLVRKVLIYLDRLTNLLLTVEGTAVLDNGVIPIPLPQSPHAEVTRSAWVQLSNGQTTIETATHIDSARDFLNSGSDVAMPLPNAPDQMLFSDENSQPIWSKPVIDETDFSIVIDEATLTIVYEG